jgi:hypothetical protein
MSGNAVMMEMGIDLAGLQKDAKSAEDIVAAAARKMEREMSNAKAAFGDGAPAAGKGGGGKSPAGGHGDKKGGHGGMGMARMMGDTLDAATGSKGWVMKMQMLSHSLTLGAIAGGVVAAEKMVEALEKMGEAAKGARAELAKPMASTIAQGPEAVKKSMESIDEAKAKLQETRTFMGTMGDVFLNPLKGLGNKLSGRHLFDQNGNDESLKLEQQLDDRKMEMSAKFSAELKTQTAERSEALHMGSHELAIFQTELETREKIAKIKADTTLAPDAQRALIDGEKKKGADKLEGDKASYAAYTASIEAEEEINAVRKAGDDVAVKTLEARLRAEREGTQSQTDEQTRAHAKNAAALEIEIDAAKKATAEKKAQASIEKEVADLRGDSDAKHALQLDREAKDLLRQKGEAKPDELPEINKKIAKNAEAQRSAAAAKIIRDAQTADTLLDARTGEGPGAHIQNLSAKLGAARNAQVGLDNSPDASAGQKADAAKKVHDLELELTKAVRSQGEFTGGLREANDELDAQIAHHDQIAQALHTQFEFHRKIEEADRNGNKAAADDLRVQERKTLQLQLQNLQTQAGDKNKATLAELATNAHNQSGKDAREAQRLEARAEKQRKQGHVAEAANLQRQADDLKKVMPALKDSEKQNGLLADQLAELKLIKEKMDKVNTAQ